MADPNENYNMLIWNLKVVKNKHMSSKLVKFKKYKHHRNIWISSSILKSIKYKDKLKTHITLDQHTVEHLQSRTNLQTYNRIIKRCIRKAKKLH